MTDRISFPSAQFPALPAISLELPAKWSGVVVPATLLAARREVDAGEFRSNVIVRSQRVDADGDLKSAAKVVDDGIAELAEVEDIGRAVVQTDGRQTYAREFAYRHPVGGTLAQSWRVLLVAHEGVTDIIELIGTVSAQRPRDLAEIRTILDSAVISDSVPVGQH